MCYFDINLACTNLNILLLSILILINIHKILIEIINTLLIQPTFKFELIQDMLKKWLACDNNGKLLDDDGEGTIDSDVDEVAEGE